MGESCRWKRPNWKARLELLRRGGRETGQPQIRGNAWHFFSLKPYFLKLLFLGNHS